MPVKEFNVGVEHTHEYKSMEMVMYMFLIPDTEARIAKAAGGGFEMGRVVLDGEVEWLGATPMTGISVRVDVMDSSGEWRTVWSKDINCLPLSCHTKHSFSKDITDLIRTPGSQIARVVRQDYLVPLTAKIRASLILSGYYTYGTGGGGGGVR